LKTRSLQSDSRRLGALVLPPAGAEERGDCMSASHEIQEHAM
jgi:hypothetical protein